MPGWEDALGALGALGAGLGAAGSIMNLTGASSARKAQDRAMREQSRVLQELRDRANQPAPPLAPPPPLPTFAPLPAAAPMAPLGEADFSRFANPATTARRNAILEQYKTEMIGRGVPFDSNFLSRSVADMAGRLAAEDMQNAQTSAIYERGLTLQDRANLFNREMAERTNQMNLALGGRGQELQYGLGGRGQDATRYASQLGSYQLPSLPPTFQPFPAADLSGIGQYFAYRDKNDPKKTGGVIPQAGVPASGGWGINTGGGYQQPTGASIDPETFLRQGAYGQQPYWGAPASAQSPSGTSGFQQGEIPWYMGPQAASGWGDYYPRDIQ